MLGRLLLSALLAGACCPAALAGELRVFVEGRWTDDFLSPGLTLPGSVTLLDSDSLGPDEGEFLLATDHTLSASGDAGEWLLDAWDSLLGETYIHRYSQEVTDFSEDDLLSLEESSIDVHAVSVIMSLSAEPGANGGEPITGRAAIMVVTSLPCEGFSSTQYGCSTGSSTTQRVYSTVVSSERAENGYYDHGLPYFPAQFGGEDTIAFLAFFEVDSVRVIPEPHGSALFVAAASLAAWRRHSS